MNLSAANHKWKMQRTYIYSVYSWPGRRQITAVLFFVHFFLSFVPASFMKGKGSSQASSFRCQSIKVTTKQKRKSGKIEKVILFSLTEAQCGTVYDAAPTVTGCLGSVNRGRESKI